MTLRFSQYLLSVAAAAFFVLCSLSSTAYATLDEYDFVDGEIRIQYESTEVNTQTTITTGVLNGETTSYMVSELIESPSGVFSYFDVFSFYNETESLIPKGYGFNVTFFGLSSFSSNNSGEIGFGCFDASTISPYSTTVVLFDGNGQPWIEPDAEVTLTNDVLGRFSVDLSLPLVEKDVYRIDVQFSHNNHDNYNFPFGTRASTQIGFDNFAVNWSFPEPASVLLPKIVKTLEELPANIWGFFEDGLQKLFVPGEEDMVAYKSKWEQLLEDHLGVIYQAGGVVGEYVEAFEYSEKSTIHVPPVTLHFGQTEWTFGDWDVEIVPPGFDVLYDILRIITAFLATALFVNAMKSRFERLVGGDGNA